MSYISEIRKKIGSDPLVSVSAAVIIENEKNEILLQFRSDTKNFGTPGGNIELGEKIIDAAKREVYEETGIVLNEIQLFSFYSGEQCKMIYPNKDVVFYNVVVFYAKINSSVKFHHDSESEFLKYYSKKEIPENLNRGDRIWIEKWCRNDFSIVVD